MGTARGLMWPHRIKRRGRVHRNARYCRLVPFIGLGPYRLFDLHIANGWILGLDLLRGSSALSFRFDWFNFTRLETLFRTFAASFVRRIATFLLLRLRGVLGHQ